MELLYQCSIVVITVFNSSYFSNNRVGGTCIVHPRSTNIDFTQFVPFHSKGTHQVEQENKRGKGILRRQRPGDANESVDVVDLHRSKDPLHSQIVD